MKYLLITFSFFISINGICQSHDKNSKSQIAIGVNSIHSYQGNPYTPTIKIRPYISIYKRKHSLSFGPTFGKILILDMYDFNNSFSSGFGVFKDYSKETKVNGAQLVYNYFPNSDERLFNPILAISGTYMLIKNNLDGEVYQYIHSLETLFRIGCKFNIYQGLAANISGGAGADFKIAESRHYSSYYNGKLSNYKIFNRIFPSLGLNIGLEYKF